MAISLLKQHPLALALAAMLLGFAVFPFGMYGYPYMAGFIAVLGVWIALIVACFWNDIWKGTLAFVAPFVLVVPYFFAGFWISCRFGVFGGCL
ncbi:MAG: hypothetical protein WBQ60_10115 [Asticcacaulis sp.]